MYISKIPNQLVKGRLTPLTLKDVNAIALHHMASDAGIKEIERVHVAGNGWMAIGYNFWIGFDGTVYEGRGFYQGAGVLNQNHHIISIGFQGDYHDTQRTMPDAQFNAGVDLINYIKEKVPSIVRVAGHKAFMATACPGQYFPLVEMKSLVKRIGEAEMIYNYIDTNMPDWAREAVQWAVDNGVIKGTDTGLGLDDKDLRYIVWLYRAKHL